jgi:hypothetical protein
MRRICKKIAALQAERQQHLAVAGGARRHHPWKNVQSRHWRGDPGMALGRRSEAAGWHMGCTSRVLRQAAAVWGCTYAGFLGEQT